jgi:hypothetical protein
MRRKIFPRLAAPIAEAIKTQTLQVRRNNPDEAAKESR